MTHVLCCRNWQAAQEKMLCLRWTHSLSVFWLFQTLAKWRFEFFYIWNELTVAINNLADDLNFHQPIWRKSWVCFGWLALSIEFLYPCLVVVICIKDVQHAFFWWVFLDYKILLSFLSLSWCNYRQVWPRQVRQNLRSCFIGWWLLDTAFETSKFVLIWKEF